MSNRQELRDRIRRELPHLTDEDAAALALVVERLIEAYQPERIYLFGSKARGDYGPDSDFDLMVVVPDDAPESRKRSRLAYERLWGTGTASEAQAALALAREVYEAILGRLPAEVRP